MQRPRCRAIRCRIVTPGVWGTFSPPRKHQRIARNAIWNRPAVPQLPLQDRIEATAALEAPDDIVARRFAPSGVARTTGSPMKWGAESHLASLGKIAMTSQRILW